MYQQIADISVFGLSGDLDKFEGRQLLKSVAGLIQQEWVKIVLDFKGVDHVHYQVLKDLVTVSVAASTLNGHIKLANMNRYHRDILRVVGLEDFLETYDSVADAVLSFDDAGCAQTGSC
jgi:anti-anti-sigma factor